MDVQRALRMISNTSSRSRRRLISEIFIHINVEYEATLCSNSLCAAAEMVDRNESSITTAQISSFAANADSSSVIVEYLNDVNLRLCSNFSEAGSSSNETKTTSADSLVNSTRVSVVVIGFAFLT